jgi:hypothetical protein
MGDIDADPPGTFGTRQMKAAVIEFIATALFTFVGGASVSGSGKLSADEMTVDRVIGISICRTSSLATFPTAPFRDTHMWCISVHASCPGQLVRDSCMTDAPGLACGMDLALLCRPRLAHIPVSFLPPR